MKRFRILTISFLLVTSAFGSQGSPNNGDHSCPWAIAGRAQLQLGVVPFHFAYHGSGAEFFFATQRQKEYKLQGREVDLLTQIFSTPRVWLPNGSYTLVDIGPGNGQKAVHIARTVRPEVGFQQYVAIDSSDSVLSIATNNWLKEFPGAAVESMTIDFADLPINTLGGAKLALFIGQTLGNVSDRLKTLRNIRSSLSEQDRVIVGVELLHEETPSELSGYSNPTNLEIYYSLFRSMGIERENLSPDVRFNPASGDFEMGFHVARDFSVGGQEFKAGQTFKAISHRFTLPELHALLTTAGFSVVETFTDPKKATALVVARPK